MDPHTVASPDVLRANPTAKIQRNKAGVGWHPLLLYPETPVAIKTNYTPKLTDGQ